MSAAAEPLPAPAPTTGGLARDDTLRLLDSQTRVLELIADGAPLGDVLSSVVTALEGLLDGTRCSILLLDPVAGTLRHGAAPNLPAQYVAAIDGLAVGRDAGSCGTAAYLGHPVVAEDVRTDPRWLRFRHLARPHGLRSCWSTPIRARSGIVGTFAVYTGHPHRPTPREEVLVERLTHLASVAIDHAGLEAERRGRREAEVARSVAEAASRAKTDFLSAMSHELRTPLQAIRGFTELLRTLDLPPDRRTAALEHIESASAHVTALVDDVLDISRIEAGALPVERTPVDVRRLFLDVVELLAPVAASGAVTLVVGPGPDDVHALADERRLRQVLINLVSNGIRYNRADGTVTLTVDRADGDGRVVLRVADTGRGIPDELRERLFVPFDRLGSELAADGGIGLGLSLAHGLTTTMGGRLGIESTVGVGTTVTLTMPAGGSVPDDGR